jgi:osmotically-inducible protein OsmY
VRAVADDIEVTFPQLLRRSDGDIATAAANQIEWSTTIPQGSVQVTVTEGRISLEGNVEWWYQKEAAEDSVRYLAGVKRVFNLITIKPKATPAKIEAAIKAAFERNAVLDAKKIEVETSGNKVTLTGKVRNYAEREEAERIAWAAPGVSSVDSQLAVEWSWE